MRVNKGQYTTPQLRRLAASCHDVFPVFGRPEGLTVVYAPRTKYDPKPWASHNGTGFRYAAYELTAEPQHTPEVTDGEWLTQRHLLEDHGGIDLAFAALLGVYEPPAGVAA